MKKLLLMAGIVCATVSGSLTNVNAAPFAMPPYYNVPNDNKYPFYGDVILSTFH